MRQRQPDTQNTQRVRETRAMYVGLGLCPYCQGARPAEPGLEGCRPCRAARNRRYNERRRQRLASGICYKCRGPLDGETTLCRACVAKHQARCARHYHRRVEAGRCRCGLPTLPEQALCGACAAENRERSAANYQRRRARQAACAHSAWATDWEQPAASGGQIVLRWRQRCAACGLRQQPPPSGGGLQFTPRGVPRVGG